MDFTHAKPPEDVCETVRAVPGPICQLKHRECIQETQGILKTQEVERRRAATKCRCSRLGELLGPHVIIEPPKAIIEYHPEALGWHPDLDTHGERGVYLAALHTLEKRPS
jgi:hypothetical protein